MVKKSGRESIFRRTTCRVGDRQSKCQVPSPSSGILEKISVKEGETVNVGSLLGTISKKDTVAKPKESSAEKKYTPPKNIKEHSQKEVIKEAPLVLNNIEEKNEKIIHEAKPLVLDQIHKEKNSRSNQKGATPSARKMASEVEYKFRRSRRNWKKMD